MDGHGFHFYMLGILKLAMNKMKYVLLDEEGQPIRYFDYPAEGAVEVVEPKLTFDEMMDKFGEALL